MIRRLVLLALLAAALPVAAAAGDLVATITSGPPDPVSSHSATFAFAASDPQALFGCALDGAAFEACSSPVTLADVPDGRHTFFVVAHSASSTAASAPAYWTWTVDTTPPPAVTEAHKDVGYRRLVLSWAASADTDHVVVLRSTSAKEAAGAEVYSGPASSYAEPGFVNASYHRYAITSYDKAGNASPAVQVVVPASALLLAPADGAELRAKKPQMFRWRAIQKASYYNIQLWRDGRKLLTTWPRTPKFRLPASWKSRGHRYELTRGYYTWFVWPGFGPLAKGRYGDLAGHAQFRAG